MFTNSELGSLSASDDRTVAALATEVIRLRNVLLNERRRCAELAGAISQDAGAAVREYAQMREIDNALGSVSLDTADQLPSRS